MSLFAQAPIPWSTVLEITAEYTQRAVGQLTEDLEDQRTQLFKWHLLQKTETTEQYRLHTLIREFFIAKREAVVKLEQVQKNAFCAVMVQVAQTIPQTPKLEDITRVSPLISHLAEVADHLTAALSDEDLGWPFVGLGRFYEGQGLYALAEPWYSKCLTITQSRLGKDHPAVALSLNNLALLYKSQGKYAEAEPLHKRALGILETVLGTAHPDVAQSLNNLAALYHAQGKYAEAEPLYERALGIRKTVLGPVHPDVAQSLNNLAELYRNQGKYWEAEPLYERALGIYEKVLGPAHSSVATSLNNLAGLYESQGKYAEAEPYYLRAIAVALRSLGIEHPSTLTILGNFYATLQAQGQCQNPEDFMQYVVRRLQGPLTPP